jgi:hypothetical protein
MSHGSECKNSSMVNSNILDLARQGNPEAIAKLMNQSLRVKQITVVVSLMDNCLTILASAPEPPNRTFMVNFVREGMEKLNTTSIQRVRIRSFQKGAKAPSWQEVLVLRPEGSVANGDRPIPQTPITHLPAPFQVAKSPVVAPENVKKSSQPKTVFSQIKAFFAVCLFIMLVLISLGLAVGCRLFTAILAEDYLYKIQILGDLLRGLEMGELFNILVFAILGMGLGIATALVPKDVGHRIGVAVLIVALPVIFSLGSFIRYQGWVNSVATQEEMDRHIAVQMTDKHLASQVGSPGFLGFYLYTAQYPILPTRTAEMQEASEVKAEVSSKITHSINKLVEIQPNTVSTLFSICIWSIRLFYFGVSIVTAIVHLSRGEALADTLAKRS